MAGGCFCCKWKALAGICVMGVFVYFLESYFGSWYGVAGNSSGEGGKNGGPLKDGASAGAFNLSYAQDMLTKLCDEFDQKMVAGDLCNSLCYRPGADPDSTDSNKNLPPRQHKILDLKAENKYVIILSHAGQKLVLKSTHPYMSNFDQLPASLTEAEYISKVLDVTNYNLALDWPLHRARHLIDKLWRPWRHRNDRRPLTAAERASLWTLANQDEFLTFSVLPLVRAFPKIMGSCGHFYAVEHVVPFKFKSYYSNLKAKILVHLMGTLKLFYEFLNEPLHWCDVKFENFGLSADYPKRFLVMDADMLFTDSRMHSVLTSLPCRSDNDCQFFDCTTTCDQKVGHCRGQRTNDNIEVFCGKLVYELFGNFYNKGNRYLNACHDKSMNATERLKELRLVWAWSLSDV